MAASCTSFPQRFTFFSQHTTFHGYRELAESRRWLQKLVWISIMLGSVAMLAYSLRKQVNRYLSDPMMTRITQLADDEPYKYPKVWFELDDWMWIDTEKIDRFELSYDEIQYARAFFGPNVTLESNKNVTDIGLSLRESMDRMNASGLNQFFSLLAFAKFNDDSSKWRFLLKGLGPNGVCYYCMDLSWTVEQNYSQTFHGRLQFDYSAYYENARRLADFFKNQTASDRSKSIPGAASDSSTISWLSPHFFNIDTNQMIRLNPGFQLVITIDSKVYRKLRDCRREKEVEEDLLYYKHVCQVDCEMRTNTNFGQSCVMLDENPLSLGAYVSRHFRDGTVNVCHHGLWINGGLIGGEKPIWKKGEVNEHDRTEALRKCRESCLPKCERTSTSWTTQISPLSSFAEADGYTPRAPKSEISIDFPDRSTLIIFEEVVQYDWNDMISDLGGLLGLWLGASMMSLFQVVHLCFWADGGGERVKVT